MSHFELMEQTLQRSYELMQNQEYAIARNILTEALSQFQLFKKQSAYTSEYDVVEGAIRDEMQLLDDVQTELNRIKQQPKRDDDEDNDYAGQYAEPKVSYNYEPHRQPYKPNNVSNTPSAYRNVQHRQNQNTPAAEKLKKDYEKPWLENKPKEDGKTKDGKKKAEDDFPSSYEGVEPRFAEEIHAIMIKNSTTTYDDVAGLEEVKRLLDEAITYPMQMPELFAKLATWRGVLLYGPPGTGKTEIAKAVANKANCCFFAASASTIMSKYVGESEKIVRALFTIARYHAPSIIFLDEVDAIMSTGASNSENPVGPRLRQEILTQMQGVGTESGVDKEVLVLAATNHPWNLDQAMIRRLEKRIYLPLPEQVSRKRILEIKLKDEQLEADVDLDEIAQKLDGYSGADIDVIVRDARMQPMRRIGFEELLKNKERYVEEGIKVSKEDFEKAIHGTKPSVTKADLGKYEKFSEELGSV